MFVAPAQQVVRRVLALPPPPGEQQLERAADRDELGVGLGLEAADPSVELGGTPLALWRETTTTHRVGAEVAHAAVVGREGRGRQAVHEDLVRSRADGEHVTVEIAVETTGREMKVERRLEMHRCLRIREGLGRPHVDDLDSGTGLDRARQPSSVRDHQRRRLGEGREVGKRPLELAEVGLAAADDEDEALLPAHALGPQRRYQSSSTATFQSRQTSPPASSAAMASARTTPSATSRPFSSVRRYQSRSA